MSKPFRILTAQGVGDSVWAAFKMEAIAKAHGCDKVEILVGGWDRSDIECRALPLLRRFPWVSDVRFLEMPRTGRGPVLKPGAPTDELGRYRYIDDGKPSFQLMDDVDFVAIPNGVLEYGTRLEDWLPEYPINWSLFNGFILPELYEPYLSNIPQTDYVVFFMGALGCNHPEGVAGHNHGALWTGEQWAQLGDRLIQEMNTEIVVVGAGYDEGYYEKFVRQHIRQSGKWHYRLAEFALMETLSICAMARAVVSYQSGIGIMSHYVNVPKVVMWWRPDGNSIVKGHNVCFDERMASAWTYPNAIEEWKYMPCIYGRESVDDIVDFVTD